MLDEEVRKQELGKALKCYRAVVDLSSKIDESLVEEARREIYQIEAMQVSMS
jgi:tRNA U54 and U55 pseudouridine synthase Pus10